MTVVTTAVEPLTCPLDSAHTHTHTTVLLLFWNMSGTTRVSRYQKGKTKKDKANLDGTALEIICCAFPSEFTTQITKLPSFCFGQCLN